MTHVLIIDDDRMVMALVERALREMNVHVSAESSGASGLKAVGRIQPDVLLLDIKLPDVSGLEIAGQIREMDPKLPIVFITVLGDSDTAIEATKCGAYEFLLKPLDIHLVQDVVRRALETRRLMRVPVALDEIQTDEPSPDSSDALIGRSPQMLNVYGEIGRVAGQDVSVLICGASGTGKELVARAIYQHSQRNREPFLAVNCAALSEMLLESELFGHEKGSFTGADRRHIGKFEQANHGTIFLDEVGDMSPTLQSKVLRLLQEQRFERVGGRETITTDVRIIAATNRDIDAMVRDQTFRLDLYHRLNDYRIDLPPLRERGEDIALLVGHCVRRFARKLNKPIQGVSPEALQLLKEFPWPGNVRELQTVLKTAVLKATGPVIVPEFLPDVLKSEHAQASDSPVDSHGAYADLPHDLRTFIDQRQSAGSNALYRESLQMMERYLITHVLRQTSGKQSRAAEILGITRGSLRHKLQSLGISIKHLIANNEDARDSQQADRQPTSETSALANNRDSGSS
ncbi:MAG TPA: sigma-54 dependent transcriptional regulator [Pirellulaceae bacterium]|nr:sigma-54 dependent transcriptional regulator [Pirellulaceae bacterium]